MHSKEYSSHQEPYGFQACIGFLCGRPLFLMFLFLAGQLHTGVTSLMPITLCISSEAAGWAAGHPCYECFHGLLSHTRSPVAQPALVPLRRCVSALRNPLQRTAGAACRGPTLLLLLLLTAPLLLLNE
jgi:hypothetical protein